MDTTTALDVFGFGSLYAEHSAGKPSLDFPIVRLMTGDGSSQSILLGSKVKVHTFKVDPKLSLFGYFQHLGEIANSFVTSSYVQTLVPKVNFATHTLEGVIEVTTEYKPEKLSTHISGGFSGGPVIQNDKVLGVMTSSEFKFADVTRQQILSTVVAPAVCYGILQLAAIKFPKWQLFANLYSGLYLAIPNVLAHAVFNKGFSDKQIGMAGGVLFLGRLGYQLYKHFYPGGTTYKVSIRRITPDLMGWMRSKLAEVLPAAEATATSAAEYYIL